MVGRVCAATGSWRSCNIAHKHKHKHKQQTQTTNNKHTGGRGVRLWPGERWQPWVCAGWPVLWPHLMPSQNWFLNNNTCLFFSFIFFVMEFVVFHFLCSVFCVCLCGCVWFVVDYDYVAQSSVFVSTAKLKRVASPPPRRAVLWTADVLWLVDLPPQAWRTDLSCCEEFVWHHRTLWRSAWRQWRDRKSSCRERVYGDV